MTKQKAQAVKPKLHLSDYLRGVEKPAPKTIRASQSLWVEIERLAHKYDCSLNQFVIATLTKALDEEKEAHG